MSSSAARKARIGEVPQAEGFGKNQRRSFSKLAENNPCGLCRHPYPRIGARTPPIASQTEGDIAMFQPLNYYVTKSHCPWDSVPIPRRRGGTGEDIAAFRQYKLSKLFVLHSTWILSLDKINCISVSLVSAKTYQSIKTMPATPANRRCECPF